MMLAIAGLVLLAAVTLGMFQGKGYAIAVVVASALGLSYKLRVKVFNKIYSIRAIPGSKDILITLALALIGLVLPAWQQGHFWGQRSFSALFFAGALVFARSIIVSLTDMQKDQILGRETLPTLIGRGRSQSLMYAFLALAWCLGAVQTFQAQTMSSGAFIVLTLCTIYPILYQWIYRIKFSAGRPRFDPGVEPALFLAGLMALL
jgi:4-hydroxy-3-methylbut-2-enyl diphosphate reductase